MNDEIRSSIMLHDIEYLINGPAISDGKDIIRPKYYTIKSIEQSDSGKITITTTNLDKFEIKPQKTDGKEYELEIGNTLFYDIDGKLQVNVTDRIEEDNTLPISSSAVSVEIGNINVLLGAI